jgi:hypothetical protein
MWASASQSVWDSFRAWHVRAATPPCFTNLEPSLGGKWLELLREIAPGVKRVAFMFDPALTPITPLFFRSVESAAPKLAVEPVLAHVQSVVEMRRP